VCRRRPSEFERQFARVARAPLDLIYHSAPLDLIYHVPRSRLSLFTSRSVVSVSRV
jgi:hypothetical protein